MANNRELLELYLEGETDDDTAATLAEALREDAGLRRELVKLSLLDVQLATLLAARVTKGASSSEPATAAGRSRYRIRQWWIVSGAIAASLLIAVAIWWATWPPVVANVVQASNATGLTRKFGWENIRQGESISVPNGVVEITTRQGVRLVLEGPCDCRFETAQLVYLANGRFYADVPVSGHGFTVQTPAGNVVDLGTRFGIDVKGAKRTEVHVFEGLVIAGLPAGAVGGQEVREGKAVALETSEIDEIKLHDKFIRSAGPYLEQFAYHNGPLDGKDGWLDSRELEPRISTHPKGLNCPYLARSRGDSMAVNSHQRIESPVGRRWSHRFFSVLVEFTGGFCRNAYADRPEEFSLLSFAADDAASPMNVRLLAKAGNKPVALELGLVSGESEFSPRQLKHSTTHFVVFERAAGLVRLWINPPASQFGVAQAPRADIEIAVADAPAEWLWIGNASNPGYASFLIDEIRGGDTWAEVTPAREK